MLGRIDTAAYLDAFLGECSVKDPERLRANRLYVVGRERKDVLTIVKHLKEAGLKCCVLSNTITLSLGEIKLSARVSVLGPFRSYFRFPPDRMRKARERSVLVRRQRSKGSNVGMSFSRRDAAKCRKGERCRLAWHLI